MIYLIILIAILYLVYHYDYKENVRYKWLCYWTLFLLMGITAGLRYRLGVDTLMYEKHFEWDPDISSLSSYNFSKNRFGILFLIFQASVKSIMPEFLLFQMIHNLIVIGVFFWFFKNNTKNVFTATLLFYVFLYTFAMEVMREALAVCVFLLAWRFFLKGKWIPYYLMAIIAFGFHVSATVMFFLPVLYLPKIRQLFVFGRRQLIILPAVLILGISLYFVFYKYVELIALTDQMSERVNAYSTNKNYGGMTLNIMGGVGLFVRQALLPLLAMYFINKNHPLPKNKGSYKIISENPEDLRQFKLQFMVLVGLCGVMLTIPIFIMQRFQHYFMPFSIILISDWMFTTVRLGMMKINMNYIYWIMILLPSFYFESFNYTKPVNDQGTLRGYMVYYPYSSYLDPQVNPEREKVARILLAL